MKVYGYCRISTSKQSMERQIRNIKLAYPDAVIVKEFALSEDEAKAYVEKYW